MKTASEIMNSTTSSRIALALIYIEHEREMFGFMKQENEVEVARKEGIMRGILTASELLGVKDLYGTTITDLRYAIQEERKAKSEQIVDLNMSVLR